MRELSEAPEVIEAAQEQLAQQLAGQTLLLQISQQLAASFDLSETMPDVARGALQGAGADWAVVVLRDLPDDLLFHAGDFPGSISDFEQLLCELSSQQQLVIIDDLAALAPTSPYAYLRSGFGAIGVWPLQAENWHQGALWVGYKFPHQFVETERTFLSTLAGQAAIAAANIRSYQEAASGRQRLEAILRSTADPVLVIDRERRISLLNPAAEDLLNMKAEAVLRKPVAQVFQKHPGLLSYFDEDTELKEEEWVGPDGRTFSPRLSQIEVGTDEFSGWVLILRDITHYKLLHRNQEEFVRLVSHDLRSPLTFMQGFASLLTMTGQLSERQVGFVEKILNGISQMTLLVDNIQDAGRWDPQTGFYEMSREPCDLTAMVQEIVANHQGVAEKQGITLAVLVSPGVPIVNVDSIMVERALINLVSNAIKYSPNGGKVNVSVEVKQDTVLVCVADSGLGISEENLKKLFERGNRIVTPETKKHKIKGSGLGLFIVRSVARWHQGDAWAESELGKGSRFYFSIPLTGPNLVGGR